MALNCGFCGTEIKGGYRGCSACGAVLRRPPLRRLVLNLFLLLIAVGVLTQIGIAVRSAILPYSELLASLVGICILTLLPLAAVWFLVKYHVQRRWYNVSVRR